MLILRFVFLFSIACTNIAAQNFPCELPENKKAKTLFEDAQKEKLFSKRRELLKEVISIEPDHYPALYLFAYENIKLAEKNIRMDYKFAVSSLQKVISLCPKYHAFPYYYLGAIFLGEKKYDEAEKYLRKFLDFIWEDDTQIPKDFEVKRIEAEKMLERATYYANIFKNPVPFNPSLVEGISTSADEYLAIVSPDNEHCFFTRKTMKVNKNSLAGSVATPVEEFMKAEASNGKFNSGEKMPPPFNLTDNVGGASVSVDNRTIFVTICKRMATGYYNCDIYETKQDENGNWSQPANLGPGVNSNTSFEGQPTVSADGKTLYFVSIRKDEIGSEDNMDLYVSQKMADGNWSMAKNLGVLINTRGNEKSPFLHQDSHTLYFSSDSLPGMGGFDIFYTRQDENGKWISPRNIGYPINTENDDLGFFVSNDGKTAYFSSNVLKMAGGWDLYSFPLYKEARPEKIMFIRGEIKNEKNEPAKNAVIELKNTRTKETTQIDVDSITGKYVAVFSVKDDIVMNIKKDSAAFESRYFSKKDTVNAGKPVEVNVEVKAIKKGASYRINDITFETNSWDLNEQCMSILVEFASFLRENPSLKVSIHGHTDDVGKDDDNQKLSENRARAVKSFLETLQIESQRLSYKGFGKTKPVASNSTEEGRKLNRRTEFIILDD